MKLLRTLALAAFLPTAALAAPPMSTTQIVDGTGLPFCTVSNPCFVSGGGGGGGGGATGSVTPAGTNGSAAQAMQGITGGVPFNSYGGQYNSTLPTFANGQTGYLAVDVNGRQILSPTVTLPVSIVDGGDVTEGAKADAAATNGTGSWSVVALLKGIYIGLLAPTPAGTNVIGKVGIDQTTPGTTNGVQITNQASQTTSGAIAPPTAAAGKITRTSTNLTASTSTTIAAANANRIAFGVQCASGGVSIDETGGTLTAAGVGNGTLFVPAGTAPYFTPPVATQTAVTAYTATAQACVVTEYLR